MDSIISLIDNKKLINLILVNRRYDVDFALCVIFSSTQWPTEWCSTTIYTSYVRLVSCATFGLSTTADWILWMDATNQCIPGCSARFNIDSLIHCIYYSLLSQRVWKIINKCYANFHRVFHTKRVIWDCSCLDFVAEAYYDNTLTRFLFIIWQKALVIAVAVNRYINLIFLYFLSNYTRDINTEVLFILFKVVEYGWIMSTIYVHVQTTFCTQNYSGLLDL